MKSIAYGLLAGCVVLLAGCVGLGESPVVIPPTALPTSVPEALPTATPALPVLLLVVPADMNMDAERLAVQAIAAEQGYLFEEADSWQAANWPANVERVVGLLPIDANRDVTLFADNPEVEFLIVGSAELTGSNVSVLAAAPEYPWQVGFVAGYTAAVLSSEWRTGALFVEGQEAGGLPEGYAAGARYYCGLCSPLYPPFVSYPITATVPDGADGQTVAGAIGTLNQSGIQSLFLVGFDHLATPPADFGALALVGYSDFGGQVPNWWHAAVVSGSPTDLADLVSGWLQGEAGGSVQVNWTLEILSVDEAVLTPGRLENVKSVLPGLSSGLIAP